MAFTERSSIITAGLLVASLMIASQVGGKATRDALFLSFFDITSLPLMMICAAAVSLGAVLLASRTMALYGPGRVVPFAFLASGLAFLAEWILLPQAPEAAVIAVYLHETLIGSIVISGFWSIVNESCEAQSAKKYIAYVGCAGTAGGLIGCIFAQWIAVSFSVSSMLPLLGGMHLLCAWFIRDLSRTPARQLKEGEKAQAIAAESRAFGFAFRVLRRRAYARDLALLIMLTAGTAVLVSYVFKAQAAMVFQGEELLQFFASFYMAVSLATFLVQSALSRFLLEHLGGARTLAALPATVAATAAVGAIFPGFASAVLVGGVESVLRNSVFRVGYESLYVPISKRVKRSVKSIIDVGFDRVGSVLGGGVVHLLILFGSGLTHNLILVTAVAAAMVSVFVAIRLRHGYIRALERRLIGSYNQPMTQSESRGFVPEILELSDGLNPLEFVAAQRGFVLTELRTGASHFTSAPVRPEKDLRAQFAQLCSGKPEDIQAALSCQRLDRVLAPQAISLLAWSEVSPVALNALQQIAPSITGLLADELLDQNNPPQVRSQIPEILRLAPSDRTVDALIRGFDDKTFEVRFQCGRALAAIREDAPEIKIATEAVYEALKKELSSDGVHASFQTLREKPLHSFLTKGIPVDQVNWKLEHTFMVLSLLVEREPLKLTFQGLHSAEAAVRATALEYLASFLPRKIRFLFLLEVGQIARQPFGPA